MQHVGRISPRSPISTTEDAEASPRGFPAKLLGETSDSSSGDAVDSHTPAARLPCPSCSETFARAEHLTRHLRKHTGEKPYVCSSCGKVFSRSDSMKRHETLHSTSPRCKKSDRSQSLKPGSSTEQAPTGLGNRPSVFRSTTYHNFDGPRFETPVNVRPILNGTSAPRQAIQSLAAASMTTNGLGSNLYSAMPNLGTLDPSVMSDVNWFPLTAPSELELNPFEFFLEPEHDWTADLNATYERRIPAANGTPNNVSNVTPINGFALPTSPSLAQSPNNIVNSPQFSTGASSDASLDDAESTGSRINGDGSIRGESYVDGGVTRLPKGRKRRKSTVSSKTSPPTQYPCTPKYGFSSAAVSVSEDKRPSVYICSQTYDSLLRAFRYTCTGNATSFEPFETDRFLNLNAVDELVCFAVDHFLPTLPFIHKPTLRIERRHWTLYLALATIGARYSPDVDERQVYSFNEFLRRTLTVINEQRVIDEDIDRTQAKLLASIALLHSCYPDHQNTAKSIFRDLVRFYDRSGNVPELQSTMPTWKSWVVQQSICRTTYAIWLIDCMMAYQFSARTLLHLNDAIIPLPSNDNLWQISGEDEFVRSSITVNPSLKAAAETLYMEKTVSTGIGEFGRILLVHALFRQTWDKLKESQSRLSTWEPHAKAQISCVASPPSSSEPWPPGIPLYFKWRNAACDCLDVLHWHANSVIGAKSGHEHPTVLFLHLARVVLLSPLDIIRDISTSLADGKVLSGARAQSATSKLFRWAHEDCYKARLAIIHAGALLYHVRRHSMDSFYEPSAVFLSVLCLWAYGSAHARKVTQDIVLAEEQDNFNESLLPEFIHLDRPCDDELVQMFITHGNRIVPNITGVGDLCALGGPRKVLKLGCSILRYARNWDTDGAYEGILTRLQSKSADLEQQMASSGTSATSR